jgi:hypothetical protein
LQEEKQDRSAVVASFALSDNGPDKRTRKALFGSFLTADRQLYLFASCNFLIGLDFSSAAQKENTRLLNR